MKFNIDWKKILLFLGRYVIITVAAGIYATGVSLFLDPNDMAPGGIAGVAVILSRIIPVSLGMIILLLNVPILALGWWKFGIRFVLSTLYTIVVSSFFMDVIAELNYVVTSDKILAAIIGGSLMGGGIGMAFRMDTTTGGVDVVIKVLRQKYQQIKSGEMLLMIDGVILVAAALFFKNIEVSLYAGVAIFISTMVMDKVLYGSDGAKLVYIISDKRKIISTRILAELRIGVTLVEGKGAYNMNNTEVIMCVMHKQRLPKVRAIVKEVDKNAFMIVSSATEVFGEGFKRQDDIEM